MKFIDKTKFNTLVMPTFKEMIVILNKLSIDYRIFNEVKGKNIDKVIVYNTTKGLQVIGFMHNNFIDAKIDVNPKDTFQLNIIDYNTIEHEFRKIYYNQKI